jgi:FkbM family methyltransferase
MASLKKRLAECVDGVVFEHFWNDYPIGFSLQTYGEWAKPELDLLLQWLSPGDIVVDVGANIGTHAVAFAKAVGPAGLVLAFEPQPQTFELLRGNLERNMIHNVQARAAGLSDAEEQGFITDLDDTHIFNSGGASIHTSSDSASKLRVPLLPLDASSLKACSLVKIDVEGMEAAVIRGMSETLRLRPVVVAECNSVEAAVACFQATTWNGYSSFVLRTPAFNPSNFKRSAVNPFGSAQETNLVFVPSGRTVPDVNASPSVELIQVHDLDTLAQTILETPRLGDANPHDRISPARYSEMHPMVDLMSPDAAGEDLRQRVRALADQLEHVTREFEAAASHRDALLQSSSWRLTAPLRALRNAIRLVMR